MFDRLFSRVCPAMESVEVRSCGPVSADVRLMMSHSTRTAGGSTADPTGASAPEAFPAAAAAEGNRPTEKQKKRKKKKGIPAFCGTIWKAMKRHILCCDEDDIACSDPRDDQPDLSGLQWPLSADPCPSGIELPINTDTADLELMSVSDISSPEPSPESDPELMSVSDISSPEPSPESEPELMSVSDISSPEPSPESDPELMSVSDISSPEPSPESDPELMSVSDISSLEPSIMELMSVSDISRRELSIMKLMSVSDISRREPSPVPSFCSIELTPDVDPADPEPSPVPGPSALDSEIPGPSGLGAASVFDSWFTRAKKWRKKAIPAFLHRRWRAVERSVRRFQRSNKADSLANDPVAHQDPADLTDPEPSPVPGPSALDSEIPGPSGLGAASEKQKKKSICTLFCQKWRTVERSVRCFHMSNKAAADSFADEPVAHQDPADLQPRMSVLSWLFTDPGPSYYNWTSDPYLDNPEPSPVPGPSGVVPVAKQDPADSQSGSANLDSHATLDSGSSDLVSELSVLGPSSSWETSVSSLSSLELTPDMGLADPEPKPVPGALDEEAVPGALDEEAVPGALDEEPVPGALDEEPVPGALDEEPVPGALDEEAVPGALDEEPVPGALDEEPVQGALDEEPVPGALDEEPVPGALDEEPVPGALDEEPVPGALDEEPVPGALDEEPVPGPSGVWPATGSISSFYERKRELGRGGFGIVCEGTRRFDGQKVAIKFQPKSSWDKFIELPGSTKPLLAEVAVNLLMRKPPKSPHVVQMLDWFDEPEQYALILEYPHPCETLLRFIMRKGGFLDETVARGLMRQAVLAAKFCVDRGVYHKDIKTDNILVNTETLQLKFIDFGCSELFKTSKGREWVVESTVWSLGRVLLETVSGDQPLSVLQSGKLDPLRPSLSKECQDLIVQCLDKSQTKSLEQMLEHAWFEPD